MKNITNILKITLILVITLLFYSFLPQHSGLMLGCGLFAFIGPNPDKYFNWDKFNILGWFNDSRGGDACGRVVGNLCEHGIDELKTYKEFAMKQKNPIIDHLPNNIIGHSRKASSGGKDSVYAQPITLRKKDVNFKAIKDTQLKKAIKEKNDDDIIFSGIHNGTIDNYEELAPKYGIPTESFNDSKVLLNILFYGEYAVLSEYIGTAALIWHNHISNKTYIFKGSSKNYESSTWITEERPLFYWDCGEKNHYISSLEDSLLFIGAVKDQVLKIEVNTLYTFKDGIKIKEATVDRSLVYQSETYYSKNNRSMSTYERNRFYHGYNEMPIHTKMSCNTPTLWTPTKSIVPHASFTETNKYLRQFTSSNSFRIQSEINNYYNSKIIKRAVFNKSRYWMNSGLMHGVYLLNSSGIVPSVITRDSSVLKPYFFVEGMIMDGITGYKKALEEHAEFIALLKDNITDIISLEDDFTKELVRFSRYASAPLLNTVTTQACYTSIKSHNSESLYTGSFSPLFSEYRYCFSRGDLLSITKSKDGFKIEDHDTDDLELTASYIRECKDEKYKDDAVFTIGYRLAYINQLFNPFSPFQDLLFSTCGTQDAKDITLFLVNYYRDFRNTTKDSCSYCPNRNTILLNTCATCKDLLKETDIVLNEINYDIYN